MTPDANDLCVFAVKRGNIEKRIDPHFYLPIFWEKVEKIKRNNFVRLGEIASFSKEITDFSEFPKGVFEYLEISGVSLGTNDYKTSTIKVIDAPSRAKMKTKNGDIVISTTRPHRGAIAEIKDNDIIASTGFSIIREIDKAIDKKWLLFTLLSSPILLQFLQRSSGGNYPAITEDEIKRVYVPLLDLNVQKNMVVKLEDKLLSMNKKNEEATNVIEHDNEYIFSALRLSKPSFVSQYVGAVHLKNIVDDRTFSAEYYHPERLAAIQSLNSGAGLSVVKLFDIVDFYREIVNSNYNPNQYLGLAGVQSQTGELSGIVEEATGQAFKYETGDILYGRLRPYLNKVLLAESSGICSTEFHVMRIKEGVDVLPGYLSAILRSDLILSQTKHMMTGNTHPRISNDDVKNLYIPVPELSVQRQIVEELSRRRAEARKLKQQAEADWAEAKAQFEKELLGE